MLGQQGYMIHVTGPDDVLDKGSAEVCNCYSLLHIEERDLNSTSLHSTI